MSGQRAWTICPDCGADIAPSWATCRGCSRTRGSVHAEPGHKGALTAMRNGLFRAECSCGFFADFDEEERAARNMSNHMIQVRRARKVSSDA